MKVPLEIAFHNLDRSETVESQVRERVEKLQRFSREITACRVAIEAPHRSQIKGIEYHVRIDISLPGDEIVVSRDPGADGGHQDLYIAIRDAFNAAERQLKTHGSRKREARKPREVPPHAVVSKLFPAEGYGFLRAPDGREIYFHENSVLQGHFDELSIGSEVRFAEETGAEGPQASTVEVVGRNGKHVLS